MKIFFQKHLSYFLMISLGTALYAFGFVNFNMGSHLAEGGISGLTLIAHALFRIDPAFTQILFNFPLLFVGYRYLGRWTFIYTIYAIFNMSFFIWLFQRVSWTISVQHDVLIAALLAGVFSGIGLGLVFRAGGTTGGSDILARLFQEKKGIPLSRTFFAIDAIILLASLATYIDLKHMMYTLIASFVASQVLDFVQSGGYTVRGMLIISSVPDEIASAIIEKMGRGVTFLNGEGGYSGEEKKVIYVVLNPREIQEMKQIIQKIDSNSFTSIINVHEVIGDFVYSNGHPK